MKPAPPDVIRMTDAARAHRRDAGLLAPYLDAPLDLTIFVSCYNEAEFIIGTLDAIDASLKALPLDYEIIVIDDVSRDTSVALVEDYIAAHPDRRIILKRNGVNRGLAQNYVDAAFLGRGKYYRLICGDNAEPADTITAVFSRVGEADMILPYYLTSEGKSAVRQWLSRSYSRIVNLVSGFRIRYYNGLAVHLRYNVMRWHPTTRGFGFQAEIVCMLLEQGASYVEVPVRTVELKGGASRALTWKNILSVTHSLVTITMRRISNRIYR